MILFVLLGFLQMTKQSAVRLVFQIGSINDTLCFARAPPDDKAERCQVGIPDRINKMILFVLLGLLQMTKLSDIRLAFQIGSIK